MCAGEIMGRYQHRKQHLKNMKRKKAADQGQEGVAKRRSLMGIGMLNLGGLKEQGMLNVKQAIDERELDIFCLIETKLDKEDLKKIEKEGFEVFEERREKANKDKKGGGLAILTRQKVGVSFRRLRPEIKDSTLAYVNKERLWVTYDSQGGKTAVCCIYMACNDNKENTCADWNGGIYKVLSNEIFKLRGEGYRIVLQGDFNAWVGSTLEEGGIPGNRRKTNKNGELFLEFLRTNNLVHVNGACRVRGDWSTRITKGLWTRHAPDYKSSTVIDYVVISAEHLDGVRSMEIDQGGELGGKSDHNMLITKLVDKFVMLGHNKPVMKTGWNIQEDQDWSEFRKVVERELENLPDDDGSEETLSRNLIRVVTKAMDETIGKRIMPSSDKNKKLPKYIVDLLKESKRREKIWKTAKSEFASSSRTTPSESVIVAAQALDDINAEVNEAMSVFSKKKRTNLVKLCRTKTKKAVQTFWSYVSRKVKKTTDISALQSRVTGVLHSEPDEVASEVYKYLKDIFSGVELEEIQEREEEAEAGIEGDADEGDVEMEDYRNREEHLKFKSQDSSRTVESDPSGFLDKDFSKEEVRDVLANLGVGKASGWDNIPNEALKEAPPGLLTKLMILYNRVKNKGKVPSAWKRGRLVLIHKKGSTADVYNYRYFCPFSWLPLENLVQMLVIKSWKQFDYRCSLTCGVMLMFWFGCPSCNAFTVNLP